MANATDGGTPWSMELSMYQVDAFTRAVFAGNPAAVCPLKAWLPDAQMQRIAAENNLSETAFFVPEEGGYALRWFTPTTEVDLCGHATLASAFVVLTELTPDVAEVRFSSRSGPLTVKRDGDRFAMDFPTAPSQEADGGGEVGRILGHADGVMPQALHASRGTYFLIASYPRPADVAALRPDFRAMLDLPGHVIATAAGDPASTGPDPGAGVDFVSRFFGPRAGIEEDPVTGSAHCALLPLWAERLGKTTMTARQISARGGELEGRLEGDRVTLIGHAALYLRGTISV